MTLNGHFACVKIWFELDIKRVGILAFGENC